jgi:hypothetical protein
MTNRGKCRSVNKINFLTLEVEHPTVLYSLEDPAKYDTAQVLIKQSRRYNYIVYLPIFLNTVKVALKTGKYTIKNNKDHVLTNEKVKKFKKTERTKTIHNSPYSILVRMDVVYGPLDSQHIKNFSVDICGACVNSHGDLAINADPVVMVWVERAIQIYEKTHYVCITNDCYFTFDANLIYGHPIICPVCNIEQCPKCKTTWGPHDNLTCELFSIGASITNITDPYILTHLYNGDMQPCPKCHTITNKIGGCNKIICESPNCGEAWCWGCGKGELRTQHSGPYDHWFEKYCSVFTPLFAEDPESAQIIRDAIRKRNLIMFGNRIKPIET